jgi:excisionase family DNA binding protein
MKLCVKQAAARAGVSASLVYEWCRDRLVPHYRCGAKGRRGKVLIEESDLDAFLSACKVNADGAPPGRAAGPRKRAARLELKHVKVNCERSPPPAQT